MRRANRSLSWAATSSFLVALALVSCSSEEPTETGLSKEPPEMAGPAPGETSPRPPPARPEPLAIAPGVPQTGSLDSEEVRSYRFESEPGQWLAASLDASEGADGVLILETVGGERLRAVDEEWDGRRETLIFGPLAEPSYRLDVRAFNRLRYTLTIELPEHPSSEQSAWAKAQSLRHQGGAEALEQAAEIWRSLGQWSRVVRALTDAAAIRAAHGELEGAFDLYSRALDDFAQLADPAWHAATYNRRGLILRSLIRSGEAKADFEAAQQLFSAADHVSGRASAINNLGLLHNDSGDFDSAQEHYETAIALLGEPSSRPMIVDQAKYLLNLARLQTVQNRPGEAKRLTARAQELYEKAGDDDGLANLLSERGWQAIIDDDARAALPYLDRAASLLGDRVSRSAVVLKQRQGITLERLGRFGDAQAAYRRAEELARLTHEESLLAGLGITWCRLSAQHVELELTEACLEGLATLRAVGDPNRLSSGLYWRARRLVHDESFDDAMNALREASGLLESLRARIAGFESRARFYEDRVDVQRLLIDLLIQRSFRTGEESYARQALEESDGLRARSVLDVLLQSRRRDASTVVDQMRGEVAGDDFQRQQVLAQGKVDAKAEDEIEVLLARLDVEQGRAAGDGLDLAPAVSLEAVQAQLKDDTVLLSLLTGEPNSYLWIVRREGFEAFRLDAESKLGPLADALLRSLESSNPDGAFISGRRLARALFGPTYERLDGLTGKRLVMVGEVGTRQIPLSVLPAADSTANEPRYLVDEHEIVLLPSLATLTALRERRREPPSRSIAILADPLYSLDQKHIGSLEPLSKAEVARVFPGGQPPGGVGRLPFAGLEGEQVAHYFEKPFLATGTRATRKTALSPEIESFSMVHIASHGWLDPRFSPLSALLLSDFDPEGHRVDGRLRLQDIYALSWRAEMIVASACETGVGGDRSLEGVAGLARGFLQSGVPRAVVSLWPVDSRATAAFMDAFYQALIEQHLPPGAALREARRHLLHPQDDTHRGWASPHIWGAFVLVGDWRSFEIPGEN